MKKLLIALACAASFAAMADVTPTSSGFENETAGTKIHQAANDTNWSQTDGDPASEVKTYTGESMATYNGSWGSPLASAYGLNYLALDTGGGELLRFLAGISNGVTNTVPVTAEAPVYIDTLVQFTATDPSTEVEIADDAKLAIWMVGDSENGYQLKVQSGAYDADAGELITTNFVLDAAVGTLVPAPNTWYRLTVKALDNVTSDEENYIFPAFEIYLDGVQLKAVGGSLSADAIEELLENQSIISQTVADAFTAGTCILSAKSGTPTLTSVGFQGSGALDDFIMTTTEPNFISTTTLDFTLAWDANVSAVSYAINGGEAQAATSGTAIPLNLNDVITVTPTFVYPNAFTAVYTPDVDGKVTASANAFTVAALGAVTVTISTNQVGLTGLGSAEDPYKIGSVAELGFWKNGTFADGSFYRLTGNISDVGSFSLGKTFNGTLDGNGYSISGVVIPVDIKDNWQAFIPTTAGATAISNLTFNATTESGFHRGSLLVGIANAAITLENVTVSGSITGDHNVAGILGRAKADATFNNCTNHATVTTSYSKIGGLFCYNDTAGGTITFRNCYNDGAITATGADKTEGAKVGGMAAGSWASVTFQLYDCVNVGAIAGTQNICSNASNCSVDIGGLVGQLAGGTHVFSNCVNSAAITGVSGYGENGRVYADAEVGGVGGFVGRCSGGSVSLMGDCSNSGTLTSTVLENPERVKAGSLVGRHDNAATVAAGSVITTTVTSEKPLGSGTCADLNFAEVASGTATFCAASAITSNKTYNVMLDNSDAIEFGETAGDFITLINSPATYSGTCEGENPTVTTASGLSISVQATMSSYTYVLSGGGSGATFANDGAEDLLDANTSVTADDVATYVAGVTGAAAPAEVTKPMVLSYMLNANKILTTPETEVIKITAIEQVSGGWKITVAAALNAADVAAGATVDMFDITGTLAVSATADLGTAFAPVAAANFTVADGDVAGTAVITVNDANAKFLKATVTK